MKKGESLLQLAPDENDNARPCQKDLTQSTLNKSNTIGVWHYFEQSSEYRVPLTEGSLLYAMILSDQKDLLITI